MNFKSLACDRWDEVGNYDIPAAIEYVLKTTGHSKLIFICHSLGCAYSSIAMINHPKLNDKIELLILLAPVASCAYSMSNHYNWISQLIYPIEVILFKHSTILLLPYHNSVIN